MKHGECSMKLLPIVLFVYCRVQCDQIGNLSRIFVRCVVGY